MNEFGSNPNDLTLTEAVAKTEAVVATEAPVATEAVVGTEAVAETETEESLNIRFAIESGEGEVNRGTLKKAFTEGRITITEYNTHLDSLLEIKEAQEAEARIDALTGLYNLKGFNEKLNQMVKELRFTPKNRRETTLESIMVFNIDVNGLKGLNDNYGHAAGDQGLIALANRLSKIVKGDRDIIARPGGDEFLILMPIDSTKENIHSIIFERFKKALGDPTVDVQDRNDLIIEVQDRNDPTKVIRLNIFAASGFAVLDKNDNQTTIEEVLKKADREMYAKKMTMGNSRRTSHDDHQEEDNLSPK